MISRLPTRKVRRSEQGYILLTLMLMVALIIVAAAVVVPTVSFEIRRDREEELIHRGVQYSRAIRNYYKKFGRYPTTLEDLESTNKMRFLRKRYKDPVTGQDFKLLHFGEVKLKFAGVLPGAANIPGAANLNGGVNGAPGTDLNGGSPPSGGFGAGNQGPQATGFAAATRTPSSDNPNPAPDQGQSPNATPDQGQNPNPSTQVANPVQDQSAGTKPSDPLSARTFGGGPVVGVVSMSKKEGIREFNHKKKYNEWQFIYDPTMGPGLLTMPNQDPQQGIGAFQRVQTLPPGSPGNTTPFGTQPGQGNGSIMTGPDTPAQPPSNPPQQQ